MVSAPSGIHSRRAAPGPKGQKVPPCLRGLLVCGPPPDHLDSPTAPPLVNRMEFDKGGVTATDLRDIWARFAGCDRQATVVAGFLGPAPTVVEDQGRRSPQPCVGFGRHRRYEGPTPNTRRSSRRYSAQSASRSTRRTIARGGTSSSAGIPCHPNSSAGSDHAPELVQPNRTLTFWRLTGASPATDSSGPGTQAARSPVIAAPAWPSPSPEALPCAHPRGLPSPTGSKRSWSTWRHRDQR